MTLPLVTILTPTWRRHDLLLTRCIPSVAAQGYPEVEHLIISDGPDPELKERLAAPWLDGWKNLWYHELPVHDETRHWGAEARNAGLDLATGDYIGYCDDDDALRPGHCGRLAGALDANPEAGFAVSWMCSHMGPGNDHTIGPGPLAPGNLGTPMVMHRRGLAQVSRWGPPSNFEDWQLAERWMAAGVQHVRVHEETCDAWPSGVWLV